MKSLIKFCYIFPFVLLLYVPIARGQSQQEIDNLVAFSKAYGYVKYFHPSTEGDQLDWGWFSVYGAQQIRECEDDEALIQKLNSLFSPFAPTVHFVKTKVEIDSIRNEKSYLTKENEYRPVYWQHYGVSKDMINPSKLYRSVRANSVQEVDSAASFGGISTSITPPIFSQIPSINEPWVKEIKNNIWMYVPMVLFEKNQQTFPQGDLAIYDDEEQSKAPVTAASLDFRLGNLINTWNVFQHFYPYFKEIDVNWEAELKESLRDTYTSDESSHIKDLQELTAKLKDGHIQVTGPATSFSIPPISWEWIEGKLVLTAVYNDSTPLKLGDEIEQIERSSPETYFNEIKKGISAGTEGWMNHRAAAESLFGPTGSVIEVTVDGEIFQLVRNVNYYQQLREEKLSKEQYRFMDNSIAYINLDNISVDTLKMIFPKLEQSSAIIADLRGYPNSNHQLIAHLLKTKEDAKWMHVDQFIYPDQVDVVGHSELGWSMKPEKPYLGDKKIIFLTDGQAISYAESYMGYIEAYDLGLIVGQPTAGTNGNINMFVLPGEYRITFTGMRVTKHDNTQFHGIGILPDVYVEKTMEGIKTGKDEFLEKALEIAVQ